MRRDNRIRWILIAVLVIIAGWYLYPTFKYYTLPEDVKDDPLEAQRVQELEINSIKRGLDLQGGIYMEMELAPSSLVNNLATNKDDRFEELLDEARRRTLENDFDFLTNFAAAAEDMDVRLERYFERDRRLDENNDVMPVMEYLRQEAQDGVQQSLNILRNRIDQFGVTEPNIYQQGDRRVVVELPGLDDIELAKDLIGQTAILEFRLEKPPTVYDDVLASLDRTLKRARGEEVAEDTTAAAEQDTTKKEQKPSTATEMDITELLGAQQETEAESDTAAESAVVDLNTLDENPFRSLLVDLGGIMAAPERNVPVINALLERSDVREAIPDDAQFFWDAQPITRGENDYYELYLLDKDAALGGDVITDARVSIGSGYDPSTSGKPVILMDMNREGTRIWSRLTGANVNKRIAIMLDNKVLSAPVVNEKISGGSSQISGSFTMDQAKNLQINLKSGSFKADMDIIVEHQVGPSLGQDSIRKGTRSALIGLVFVILFMIIYYRMAGIVANLALVLNLYFIMAVLAGFHATLTLPGIAGLILTIGMAVDANVLIFERIREEMLTGKTVRAAIDSGYSRAFFTILDANLTTLITALILYQYGTGPIKGFALTLSIGIVTSMFTAIVLTRVVFDFFVNRFQVEKLSI